MTAEPLTTGSPVRSPRAPHAPRPARTTTPPPRRRTATRPGAAPTRNRVTPVAETRSSAPRTPFVLLVVALLGFGLLALLFLNTASAQDAFRLSDQQRQSKALSDQEQALTRQASDLSNPANVAAAASKLGMVPGAVPIFLAPGQKVPTGEIIGGLIVVVPAPRPAHPATPPAATTPTKKTAASAGSKPPTATKPATTAKPPSAASVAEAMRNFAAFQRYAQWRKTHPDQPAGTTAATGTGSHP